MISPAISDIAVHLTGSTEDAVRIANAAAIAGLTGGGLTGLHTHILPGLLEMTDPSGSAFLQKLISDSVDGALKVTARLRDELAATGIPGTVRRVDLYPDEVGTALAREARGSDLFLGTLPYGDMAGGEWIEESVLFDSGRPCCFIPPRYERKLALANILIAWNGSAEAARAVGSALPLLERAEHIIAATIIEPGNHTATDEPLASLDRFLANHRLTAEPRIVTSRGDVGDALIGEIQASDADLIVMGGYGHSRFREWVLGGATRLLLGQSPIPVFTSH
ncbi:MAG TPA: universal stress protein [Devosia sp.]|nr:universal stress protein [Devosia sp.]